MKSAIAWLKSNPLIVIAVIVVLGAIGFGVWARQQSAQLGADIAAHAQEEGKLLRFTKQTVTLPSPQLDGAPLDLSGITYNQAVINRLKEIYADVSGQGQATLAVITEVNQDGHRPLMPGFFPNISGDVYRFRDLYRDATAALLNPGLAANLEERIAAVPTLLAGLPPSDEELSQRLNVIIQEGVQTYGENITEEQTRKLRAEQRQRLLAILIGRAQELDIYADPRIGDAVALNPAFPLSVRPWVYAGGVPEPWQLWESQLEFWIQQDMVAMLRKANRIGEVIRTDDDGNEITGNVTNGVAKRLLQCRITPGYVGLHVTGEVGTLDPQAQAGNRGGRSTGFQMNNAGNRNQVAGRYPNPPADAPVGDGAAVAANYFFSPTGRASNHVFDVRHVNLVLHVDFQKLPDLYNAIASVNYMTVVDQRITGVDEFDFGSLGGPYLYGPGDIVQLELVIETLWLRSWTTPLMPEAVKTYLGVGGAGAPAEEF